MLDNVGTGGTGGLNRFLSYKVATGSEGSSFAWATSSDWSNASLVGFKITNYQGTPEHTTEIDSSRSGGLEESPPITPSWGADTTLILSIISCGEGDSMIISAYPSATDNVQGDNNQSDMAACSIFPLPAETYTPGTFTTNLGNAKRTANYTVAIRGALS